MTERAYTEANRERISRRRSEYYKANRERIAAHSYELYGKRLSAYTALKELGWPLDHLPWNQRLRDSLRAMQQLGHLTTTNDQPQQEHN